MRRLLRGSTNRILRARLARKRRRRRRGPSTEIRLFVAGDSWLAWLLAPDFEVESQRPDLVVIGPNPPADLDSGLMNHPVVHYRSEGRPRIDTPFVQPRLANPIRAEIQEGLPPDLADLARDAAYRGGSGNDDDNVRHQRYREAHDHHARKLVREMLESVGLEGPDEHEDVTMVCVTNRPQNLERLVVNYQRQRHREKRLLVVTNSNAYDPEMTASRLASVENASVVHLPEEWSLGACLNHAISLCSTRYLAKIDDDDDYGEHYIGDAMLAHRFAESGVVGKHTHYVRIEDSGETFIRFPGREFEFTSYVAGGTLVVDLAMIGDIRFPDQTVGEDSEFLRRCQAGGVDVFAADRFNYLQRRTGSNTWKMPIGRLRRDSLGLTGQEPESRVFL